MPASTAALITHLGQDPARPVDRDAMDAAVDAANSWVASVRADLPVPPSASPDCGRAGCGHPPADHVGGYGACTHDDGCTAFEAATAGDWDQVSWPARCDRAAVIQAARLYGRRGSVQGVAAFAEAGVTLLARMDPDVRLLLQLGEYQDSVVA